MIGFLKRDNTNRLLQTSGSIYLFSEPMPYDGNIRFIQSFGYYSEESLARSRSTTLQRELLMYVIVYRHETENGTYRLIHEPEELVQSQFTAYTDVIWPVQKGDLVGALIPSSCTESFSRISCPSQINLQTDPWDCSAALYFPFDTDLGLGSEDFRDIPEDQFVEVQVYLNMKITIVTYTNFSADYDYDYGMGICTIKILCSHVNRHMCL